MYTARNLRSPDSSLTLLNRSPESSASNSSAFVTGWVSQPNTRGTLDIIWVCTVTIFLCTYTVLCLNVPAKSDSQLTIIGRRLLWMGHAIAGPEFVLGFAAGQYENAHRAVAEFQELGHPKWTMRHAFFAEMGGFMLHPRDSTPFPVNNNHLHWLISNKFMGFPLIETRDIWDKSKADSLIKSLVCIQICWIILNVIARAVQKLTVTTIELATVSIVFCTIATFLCWLHKPSDVRIPIDLHIVSSTAEILIAAGDAARKPYRMTPLDFVDNLGPSWSANVMAFAGIQSGPPERPLPRFTNDRFPHVRKIRQFLLVSVTLFGVGIHLFGWQFDFPTRVERILWRVASLQMFWTAAFFWAAEIGAGLHRDQTWELVYTVIFRPSRLKELKRTRKKRPSRPQPTPETFPLPWECGVSMTMWLLYLVARVYVLVEMFAGLRKLPRNAYDYVDWTSFLPHLSF